MRVGTGHESIELSQREVGPLALGEIGVYLSYHVEEEGGLRSLLRLPGDSQGGQTGTVSSNTVRTGLPPHTLPPCVLVPTLW